MANRVTIFLILYICFFISNGSQGKLCEDKEKKECPGWKVNGFCKVSSKWFGYMKDNCEKSCGFCKNAECKDKNNQCPSWASKNECQRNPKYMTVNCKKSCGICKTSHLQNLDECKDKNSQCPSWASKNECQRNPKYMTVNCKKSCGICKTSHLQNLGECKDSFDTKKCQGWAKDGECKKNPKWMKVNCRRSCKICGGECKDSFDTKKCQGWAKSGECQKSPKWMKANCQESCKVCGVAAGLSGTAEKIKKKIDPGTNTINHVYCGLRLKLRVVGGEVAKRGEWPWQVAITRKRTPKSLMCGGVLINKQWVLTASHCFGRPGSNRFMPQDLVIRIGDHNLKIDEGSEVVSNVSMIVRHEGYASGSSDHDIALIKLQEPIKYAQNIKPVCLPQSKTQEKVNQMCYVTGWGRLAENGKIAEELQEAKVPIVKRETCEATAGKIAKYTENMICAGYEKGGIDACQGDSGGPLVCNNGGRFELVGVVSWGQGCARKNSYGVYAKVSNYIDWIKANIKK